VVFTAALVHLSVGRCGSPVLGSGIVVRGIGDTGGRLHVQRLATPTVSSDGGSAPGTPEQIAGGVVTVSGTSVETVTHQGAVVTDGANDRALAHWSVMDRWVAKAKVTTWGASGRGCVTFGTRRDLRVEAPIDPCGPGAGGCTVSSGTVDRAAFDRIVVPADGAVGVQIRQPVGTMVVRRGIETFGGTGPSLVQGVVQTLAAIALSMTPGGSAPRITMESNLRTHGTDMVPLEHQGALQRLHVAGGFGHGEDAAVPLC